MTLEYLSTFVSQNRLSRIENCLESRTRRVCMVLENVLQAHNASAVLRSADAFGIQDVHLITNENKFKPSKGITRGSHKWLSLNRYNQKELNNTLACFDQLRNQGYIIACMHPHAEAKLISELDFGHNKHAFVIGSEKDGLSSDALDHCDLTLKYPMVGFSESLNLSVLAALCMSDARKELAKMPKATWQLSDTEKHILKMEWVKKSVRESGQLEKLYHSEKITHPLVL